MDDVISSGGKSMSRGGGAARACLRAIYTVDVLPKMLRNFRSLHAEKATNWQTNIVLLSTITAAGVKKPIFTTEAWIRMRMSGLEAPLCMTGCVASL